MTSACGTGALVSSVSAAPARRGSTSEVSSTALVVGVAMAEIRGLHAAALEALKEGSYEPALTDAATNQLSIVRGSLPGADASRLADLLLTGTDAVDRHGPQSLVANNFAAADELTTRIEEHVAGSAAATLAYRASVTSRLFQLAGSYYRRYVDRGASDLSGYQTAYGVLREANDTYQGFESLYEEHTSDRTKEVDSLVSFMFEAMPGVFPRELPPPPGVECAAYLIALDLTDHDEAVGPTDLRSAETASAGIAQLLPVARESYRAGQGGAAALLVDALRDEVLPVAEVADESDISSQLADLASGIRAGRSEGSLDELLNGIQSRLSASATPSPEG